jgi:hypothetical protein
MRKVRFNENQIKRLLGEDFMSYLPDSMDGAEQPATSYGTEVSVADKNVDGEEDTIVTGDDFADAQTQQSWRPWFSTSTRGLYGAPPLFEMNQDFTNRKFSIGRKIKDNLAGLKGDRMAKNMADTANMPVGTLYSRLNRLRKMKDEDPQRYTKMGGDSLVRNLERQIESAKNGSASSKKLKRDMGNANAYQKAGYTKQSGNGRAHTLKTGVEFSYEN